MAQKVDLKAKQKRQKIVAGVLGAVLLAVLTFQVPRTLKMLHGSSASASPPAETTTATAASSIVGGTTAPAGGGSDTLSDPGVLPAPRSGQLLAFSRFRSKDPFAQQLGTVCDEACTSTGATGASGATGATAPMGTGASGSGTTTTPPPGDTSPPAPAPAARPTSAVISVNGASENVTVGAQFPASNPTFRLVSLTKTTAKIAIAGGSLEGGQQTVTLKKNVPLTLMNTADGTRYVLRLLSVGSSAPEPPDGAP